MLGKDYLSVLDAGRDLGNLVNGALQMKANRGFDQRKLLDGKTLALVFEKSSTRTRVSFEVAMTHLGGQTLFLNAQDLQLGRGETIADTARVLSRYVDCIAYRAFRHEMVLELATNANIPVINALDDLEHPCQALADIMTILEKKDKSAGINVAYVGDGNNVCNSLLLACVLSGLNIMAGCPEDYMPDEGVLSEAKRLASESGVSCEVVDEATEAARDADILYTDVWISMGDETESEKRLDALRDFQVNSSLLSHASPDCLVMHCLPAHRGQEITNEVIDGPQSIVLDQAENRLHAQKALLLALLK